MESLSETLWDVVISGTGLQQSLLALALSRSDKKILHIDANEYYGGDEAAFSLLDIAGWVKKVNEDPSSAFQDAEIWQAGESTTATVKLGLPRAYTLTLSPQIIYTRSKLLSQLVSSQVYKQLEFQAVGNWWIYDRPVESTSSAGKFSRLPNGREDVFTDKTIDLRAKRSLMKFLKFVVDYENQTEIWEPHAEMPLVDFLSLKFQLPPSLQTIVAALTMSLQTPQDTIVSYSLPRIARHLTSIGVFGPGFGAVLPKWGGGAEIAQVACRSGAVGGGIYVLGAGIESFNEKTESDEAENVKFKLSIEEDIKTRFLFQAPVSQPASSGTTSTSVAKTICIVSSPLSSLFSTNVEGGPAAAVSVVVFPSNTLDVEDETQLNPVYMMVHSSDTGECPQGQCVLYISTIATGKAKARIDAAVSAFITSFEEQSTVDKLYSLFYVQSTEEVQATSKDGIYTMASSSLDLAFDDAILNNVEDAWKSTLTEGEDASSFMTFEVREQMHGEDDDDDE